MPKARVTGCFCVEELQMLFPDVDALNLVQVMEVMVGLVVVVVMMMIMVMIMMMMMMMVTMIGVAADVVP